MSVNQTVFIEPHGQNILPPKLLKHFWQKTTFQRNFFSQFCTKYFVNLRTQLKKTQLKCTWLSREDGGLLPLLLVDEEGGPSSKMAVTSVPGSAAEWWQVWPPTQFYSVLLTFHNNGSVLESAFSTKGLRQLCLMVGLKFQKQRTRRVEGPGRRVSSKSPSRVWDGNQGVAGRNRREKCFPNEGSLILPSRQINDFFTKRKQQIKIDLAARPDWWCSACETRALGDSSAMAKVWLLERSTLPDSAQLKAAATALEWCCWPSPLAWWRGGLWELLKKNRMKVTKTSEFI